MPLTRRQLLRLTLSAAAAARTELRGPAAAWGAVPPDSIAPYETRYKYPQLLLRGTGKIGDFDRLSVDDPIVFRANGRFYMLYIGFDGTGYQTGLASSEDLVRWSRVGLVGPRDPSSAYTRYNLAISSILRDKRLDGPGQALKVEGEYLAAWNAYPAPGYEAGAAVIGLARSADLLHWRLTEPILRPEDGAPWERGGLYRPDLLLNRGTYYLYYNAKTATLPASEGGGWREQTGVATSRDLRRWTRYSGNPVLRNGPRASAVRPASASGGAATSAEARDSRFASNPYVVVHGQQYAMYYFGLGYQRPGRACELLALGSDPFHFIKAPGVLLDPGPPGSIDETFAHKPSVIFHDGALYHFYCAVSGQYPNEVRGVAVARSKPW